MKRFATIEALPLPVANYTGQVADPKEDALKAFFDANKHRLPDPASPEPAFYCPQMVALQYFRADYDKFIAREKITDAEIQQEYEKNKEHYDQFLKNSTNQQPAEKEGTKPSAAKGANPAAKPAAKPADNKTLKPADGAGQTPAKPAKPAAAPAEKKDTKPAENKGSNGTSSLSPARPLSHGAAAAPPVMLAAFAADNAPQPPAKATEPAKSDSAAAKPDEPAPADKAPPAGAEKHAPPAAAKPEPAKAGLPPAAKPALPDSLKDTIRRRIAQQRILKLFDGLRVKMDEYSEKWNIYDVERIRSGKAPRTPKASNRLRRRGRISRPSPRKTTWSPIKPD